MSVRQMLRTLDNEEFAFQMAYDLLEAKERVTQPLQDPVPPPPIHFPPPAELEAKIRAMFTREP
jgi:hypothetical protein